ncbi:hypothetical protein GCM10027290_63680 [Micromonospora sonneratiae]
MVDGSDAIPTPVRCPAISHPETGLADPSDFVPLLTRLGDPAGVEQAEEFPRGTLQPDGRLDLCKQGVGPVMSSRLVHAAARSGHTRHLLLGTNGLGDEGLQAVAAALPPDHRIETLYLGCNRINAAGIDPLAERLAEDQVIRALWLKRNPIGDEGVLRLCSALARNRTLRTLDLVNVGVTVRGLTRLADTLAQRDVPLERLFLGGNGLGPEAVPALGALVREAGIHELYLAANHLGDSGAAALAEEATGLPMTLGLGGNGITPAGVRMLAARLTGWQSLDLARPPSERALGAHGNVVGDEGAAALAGALPGSKLRRLDLRRTEITGRGAKLLLQVLDGHPTLEYLGLSGGVPRRMRRQATATLQPADRPLTPPHPDLRAIASVYR